ncbi:MAG TPA: exonuclease domain-containing protein [Streptosporangiaceae bacterium]
MRAPAQIHLPRRGVRPAMAALRRARRRIEDSPNLNGARERSTNVDLPAAARADAPAHPDLGDHGSADGQHWRLLPGLLPASPFLPPGDLVIVDVETTGWLADEAAITEIGAVRLGPGRPMTEFSALVNPGMPIPSHITELTGITDAMVARAPEIGRVLPGFLRFAAGSVIVAHNAPFDIDFLAAACEQSGLEWPRPAVIDTAILSRMLLGPQIVPDHRLATLACHFDATTGPCHRALADAKATAAVLKGLLGVLAGGPRPVPGPATYQPRACHQPAASASAAASRYDVAATGANVPTI